MQTKNSYKTVHNDFWNQNFVNSRQSLHCRQFENFTTFLTCVYFFTFRQNEVEDALQKDNK